MGEEFVALHAVAAGDVDECHGFGVVWVDVEFLGEFHGGEPRGE